MIRNIRTLRLRPQSGHRRPVPKTQDEPPEVVGGSVRSAQTIAVPAMPASGGASEALGRQIAEVISSDLRSTGAFTPLGPNGIGGYSVAQATAPAYGEWRNAGAGALVSGYVEAARPTVASPSPACSTTSPPAASSRRQGFTVAAADWRRAAHKCADTVYARLTGEGAFLDTRIVYVAETGPKTNRVKRIALMDSDGTNLRYLTTGRANVTTPRFSPRGNQLVYTGMLARKPRVFVVDIATGAERLLVPGGAITFAPRFSPDGRQIVFSLGAGRQYRHLRRRCRWRRPAPPDQRARRRHLAQLLARRPPDRVRKRPLGHPAALRHGRRAARTSGGSASAAAARPRRCGARAAT